MPTVADLEAIEQQARDEGFAAGRAEGLAAAQAQIDEQLARLQALYHAAVQPLAALDDATEQELARLAITVARRVIAHELNAAPELIVQAVRQAARALPASTRALRVRLNPQDLILLRELGAAENHWQLVSDAQISRGGCVLATDASRLDAQMETRLAAVVSAVLGDDAACDDAVVDHAVIEQAALEQAALERADEAHA